MPGSIARQPGSIVDSSGSLVAAPGSFATESGEMRRSMHHHDRLWRIQRHISRVPCRL